MAKTHNQSRIILAQNLETEVQSKRATLDFSSTSRGPNCSGCFNLVLEISECGHAYVVRRRCHPKGLVCSGSEILTVQWQGVTMDLDKTKCLPCRRIHKQLMSDRPGEGSKSLKQLARAFTPNKVAAKARLQAIKEIWQRKLFDADLTVSGLSPAKYDAIADEKRENQKISPLKSDSDSSDLVLHNDSSHNRPELLHDPAGQIGGSIAANSCKKSGSISRAEKDNYPESLDDPAPSFIFHSPFLCGPYADQAPVA